MILFCITFAYIVSVLISYLLIRESFKVEKYAEIFSDETGEHIVALFIPVVNILHSSVSFHFSRTLDKKPKKIDYKRFFRIK